MPVNSREASGTGKALRRGGKDASFWELKLPRETSAYVPRLLALAALVDNPSQHGISLPALAPRVRFTVVNTSGQLDLGPKLIKPN